MASNLHGNVFYTWRAAMFYILHKMYFLGNVPHVDESECYDVSKDNTFNFYLVSTVFIIQTMEFSLLLKPINFRTVEDYSPLKQCVGSQHISIFLQI